MPTSRVTTAAGTIVIADRNGRSRVLLVHRPAYDDWTLPKGKVETDEYLPATAVRETFEETGIRVRLGQPVGTLRYPVGGGEKLVSYWQGFVVDEQRRRADKEVDKVAWLSIDHALARMTYADERVLLQRAVGLPETTPFLLVRHAKAMERKNWSGRDQARPLKARGRRQSDGLVPLLAAYGVSDVTSSSSTRCMQTMKPYARSIGADVEGWSALSEEQAEENPKGARRTSARLFKRSIEGTVTAVCGHRPVLPAMLEAAGVEPRPMLVGTVAVAHVDAAGVTHAVEWHKPRL